MRYHSPSEQCKNLYRFIRLVLGEEISDREIARRWEMDEKNLRELKKGLRVVPKLSRLEGLSRVLGIHRYYVLEVASGVPADKVYSILGNSFLEKDLHAIDITFGGRVPAEHEKERLLSGLQSAAMIAHRTLDPDKIYPLVSRELKRFEFETHIFLLDQESGSATIRHSSFSPRLLHAAESIAGFSLTSFRFPLSQVPLFQSLIERKTPLFLPDASILLYQILGDRQLRKLIEKMRHMFKILEVALTPITVRGEVKGVFATGRHGKLNEACLPEIKFFSEQLSCSLENAIVFNQVKNSEDRLRTLFNNLPEGVFECDREGRIVQINQAGANILGYKRPEEPLGKPIDAFQLLNPGAQAVRKHIKKRSKKIAIRNLVGVAIREDGSSFLTDITLRTKYDRHGAVERTEGIFREITN